MIGSEPIRSENHQHFEIAHLLDGPSAEGKAITLLQLITADHQPGIALADTAEGLLLRGGNSLDTTPHDDRVDETKQPKWLFMANTRLRRMPLNAIQLISMRKFGSNSSRRSAKSKSIH